MKCYLINLDRAAERLERMSHILNSHGIDFERISAVDAKKITEQEIQEFRRNSQADHHMSPGDIACSASHLSCIQKIAEGSDQYGAVMEDDLHLSSDIAFYLNPFDWIPVGADILKLETFKQVARLGRTVKRFSNNRKLSKLQTKQWGAGIYIISKYSAEKIMSEYYIAKDYVDVYLFDKHLDLFNVYQVWPALAIQDQFVNLDANNFLQSDIHYQRIETNPHLVHNKTTVKIKGVRKIKRELIRSYNKFCFGMKYLFVRIFIGGYFGKIRYKA